MTQSHHIDHLFGRIVRTLLQRNRALDRDSMMGILSEASKTVNTSKVLWCENLTAAHAIQILSRWEGRLPVNKNP